MKSAHLVSIKTSGVYGLFIVVYDKLQLNLWRAGEAYIDGLVQECSIYIAKAMEILQSCT